VIVASVVEADGVILAFASPLTLEMVQVMFPDMFLAFALTLAESPGASLSLSIDNDIEQSHSSPIPSLSLSSCPGLVSLGQLSHASPKLSPSLFAWFGLFTAGQLSVQSEIPSAS
jgi:hypothetical protein